MLDDSTMKGHRQRAEKFGIVGAGSSSKIVELFEKYVRIRGSRDSS